MSNPPTDERLYGKEIAEAMEIVRRQIARDFKGFKKAWEFAERLRQKRVSK